MDSIHSRIIHVYNQAALFVIFQSAIFQCSNS
jgi:hypothetical protein